jgi:hypothetical protein
MLYRGSDEASATGDEDDRLGGLGRHDGKQRREVGSGSGQRFLTSLGITVISFSP